MILPIGLLVGLRISLMQKIGVGAIFCLGIIVVIFAVIRCFEVYQAFTESSPQALLSLCEWSMLEGTAGKIFPIQACT